MTIISYNIVISFFANSKFAVTRDTVVQVFNAPGKTREFNPFVLYRTYPGHVDDTTSIDWTSDSR